MARYVPEGTIEVWLVTTIADPAAPTTAELNAGTDLTASMAGDLVTPFSGTSTDAADMSSRFNKTAPGDFGGQDVTFTIHREKASGDDTAYLALPRDTTGYLAIAPRGLATPGTWATSDEVDLWPIEVLSNEPQYARNQTYRNVVTMSVPGVPLEGYALAS